MKTVFFDVDTQLDFVYPAGALYAPGAEEIVPVLGKLTQFAKESHLQLISTVDAHAENDSEFTEWKPHCVAGTVGQQKCSATLAVAHPAVLSSVPQATVGHSHQIVVEKQHVDCFMNSNLAPLLARLNADRYVVYGVVTEVCVRFAALGLLKTTGARVELVSDAVRHLNLAASKAMFDEFRTEGGIITTSQAVMV